MTVALRGIDFKQSNGSLGPPKGMTEDDVYTLPIHRSTDGKIVTVTSCWELSHEALREIQRTRKIYLQIWGMTHPPVLLLTDAFGELEKPK